MIASRIPPQKPGREFGISRYIRRNIGSPMNAVMIIATFNKTGPSVAKIYVNSIRKTPIRAIENISFWSQSVNIPNINMIKNNEIYAIGRRKFLDKKSPMDINMFFKYLIVKKEKENCDKITYYCFLFLDGMKPNPIKHNSKTNKGLPVAVFATIEVSS